MYQPATLRDGNNTRSQRLWDCCNSTVGGCCEDLQLARDKRNPGINDKDDLEEAEGLLKDREKIDFQERSSSSKSFD